MCIRDSGYRLAIVERPITAVKDIRIIVPSKTMTEVSHLLANDDEEDVHISANRRYVVFTTAGYTIMSRLIEGEFLNYRNAVSYTHLDVYKRQDFFFRIVKGVQPLTRCGVGGVQRLSLIHI